MLGPPAIGATASGRRLSADSGFGRAPHGPVGGAAHTPHLPSGRYGGQFVDLDLLDTLRSTGAVREFGPEPVGDDVLRRIFETARFAPSGGNRQGSRASSW